MAPLSEFFRKIMEKDQKWKKKNCFVFRLSSKEKQLSWMRYELCCCCCCCCCCCRDTKLLCPSQLLLLMVVQHWWLQSLITFLICYTSSLIGVFLRRTFLKVFLKFEFYFRVEEGILGNGWTRHFAEKNVPLNEMCKARQNKQWMTLQGRMRKMLKRKSTQKVAFQLKHLII